MRLAGGAGTAAKPLEALTFRAAMAVSTHPEVIAAMSYEALTAAVREQLGSWGGQRVNHRVLRAVHAAAAAPGGVDVERDAAAERAGFAVTDWRRALDELAEVETRMLACLDALELSELVTTIPGVSAVVSGANSRTCGWQWGRRRDRPNRHPRRSAGHRLPDLRGHRHPRRRRARRPLLRPGRAVGDPCSQG